MYRVNEKGISATEPYIEIRREKKTIHEKKKIETGKKLCIINTVLSRDKNENMKNKCNLQTKVIVFFNPFIV